VPSNLGPAANDRLDTRQINKSTRCNHLRHPNANLKAVILQWAPAQFDGCHLAVTNKPYISTLLEAFETSCGTSAG
jgi:hypothetical protein